MHNTQFGLSGQNAGILTFANELFWGGDRSQIELLHTSMLSDTTLRDAANTPDHVVRPGLILAADSSGEAVAWNPDATDTTSKIVGILPVELVTESWYDASSLAKVFPLIVKAPVKAGSLFVEGTKLTSSNDQYLARRQLGNMGFRFDDDVAGNHHGLINRQSVKATNYTVVAADNNTLFIAITADATFTLPALKAGLVFEFLRASDHEMVVASAEGDNMIVGNDLSADSITFTAAGEQIGARVRVEGIYVNGTLKWLVTLPYVPFGTGLATLTFAIAT